jgi:predicted O-linked N-acetylglucosamine transferase (SPINDLY family)/predicted TPR repeat methyltransferase
MASRDEALIQVRTSLSAGQVEAAAQACARLLGTNPTDLEARYLQGRCRAAQGRWSDAAADFRRVLAVYPAYYPALVDIGIAQAFSGDYQNSMRALRAAKVIDPRPAELHFGLGMCALGTGDLPDAEEGFRAALKRNPQLTDAHNNLGVVCDRQGRLADAIACFRQAASLAPGYVMAHKNLGDASLRAGDASGASAAYRQVIELAPADALGHAGLGAALLIAGDYAGAVPVLRRSLEIDPQGFDAAANLGEALRNLSDLDGASRAFERSLASKPDTAEAHLGLGRVRIAQGRAAEARASLLAAAERKRQDGAALATIARLLDESGAREEAMSLVQGALLEQPACADLHDASGDLLARKARWSEAADGYERAIAFDPARPETLLQLGGAFESMGRIRDALDRVERSLMLRPQHAEAYAVLASCAIRACDWELAADSVTRLRTLPNGIEALHPFVVLASDLDPVERSAVLRRRGERRARQPRALPQRRHSHERLRVAYLSPDIREHPVAHALVGVIEQHDRQRFEVLGVSLAASDASPVGERLRAAFDDFVDASTLGADATAELLREREIDIAVDLAGHTAGAQPAIFASHPATVQLNYLGFPGSVGADFIDFIIADHTVITPADEPLYSERVLRQPHCYLPFDSASPQAAARSRAQASLPDRGFVFCAFTNGYKISQRVFDTWLSLLAEVPESVLWLREAQAETRERLEARAAARGVPPDRLIFAPYVEGRAEYLARLRCADLFLDTLPYNAHTTAMEALWAGVPVLSSPGNGFAGRVGASVLKAAGLNELVCAGLEDYRERALQLAREPERIHALRAQLDEGRATLPVFDTRSYTRDLEALLMQAWQIGPRA